MCYWILDEIPFTPLTPERLFFALFLDSGLRHAEVWQTREFDAGTVEGSRLAIAVCHPTGCPMSSIFASKLPTTGLKQPCISINAAS